MAKASFRVDESTGVLIEIAKEIPKTRPCACGIAGCTKILIVEDNKPEPKLSTGQYL